MTSPGKPRILQVLKTRFEENMRRHADASWTEIEEKLLEDPRKLSSVEMMEDTGGEPDVVIFDGAGNHAFTDCSPESPFGRRSLCYDREALESRKEHRPENSALEMAGEMGIQMLTEGQYRKLQQYGHFDLKTSSWLATPPEIRGRGGAIFGDRRYDTVFIYHNGASSYYAARGFRGILIL